MDPKGIDAKVSIDIFEPGQTIAESIGEYKCNLRFFFIEKFVKTLLYIKGWKDWSVSEKDTMSLEDLLPPLFGKLPRSQLPVFFQSGQGISSSLSFQIYKR